jgi:hypothetical protein
MAGFAVNLKQLPRISHLAALELIDADGATVARIENRPGQTGSLSVYNHLGQVFGSITPEAARKGLEIFAEHTEDARANPGKHPNIDRLLAIVAAGSGKLRVKHQFATATADTVAAPSAEATSSEATSVATSAPEVATSGIAAAE